MRDTRVSKDITLLIAHPDDEAIFLWPFLDRVKRIVCASSDQHSLMRQWCSERGKCLDEVCERLGCESFVFGANSEFYRMETRPDAVLKRHAEEIIDAIGDPGILATHNGWGEYGHLDHILCHHIGRTVQARTGCELLVTDIAREINWLPMTAWPQGRLVYDGGLYQSKVFELDRALFERIKAIYDRRGCWTWSWEPAESCRVYSL